MLRLRSSSLTPDEHDVMHHGPAPFSGLAYEVADDGVVRSIRLFQDGRSAGPSDDWIDLPPGGTRVDSSFLELIEDYGPRLFRGSAFTGVAYSFDDSGICLAEVEYIDGAPTEVSQREWYETGDLREEIGGGEYTSWLPDGRMKRHATGGVVVYNLILRADGRLSGLVLQDAALFDVEAVRNLPFEKRFMLRGAAVDTALLRELRDRADLGTIPELRLRETAVGAEGIDVLVSLPGLRELWLEDNPKLGPAEAREIETRRRDCTVHVEV